MRSAPEGPTDAVLVLSTLGASERRRLGGRRPRAVEAAEPEPLTISRATLVQPDPFDSGEAAAAWLAQMRRDERVALAARDEALRLFNRAVRAQRAAAADPYVGEVSAERSLVARIGYGTGAAVAEGRFGEALELPRARARTRRSMQAPEERFAALVGARERALVAEELVLRARSDLDADRPREAALQARVALEALIAELAGAELSDLRADVGQAANEALHAEPARDTLERAVEAMETVLRRHRLGG